MSDTSQGEGWWLAGDGKWYPPGTATPPPTSTDASLTRQTSVNLSQEASQDDAPSEQVSVGGTSSTADQGATAPPSPRRHHRGKWWLADPASGGKPLFRKPIFWASAAAVIVIAIVAAVAVGSNHPAKPVAATNTTVSLGSAGSATSSGSTNGERFDEGQRLDERRRLDEWRRFDERHYRKYDYNPVISVAGWRHSVVLERRCPEYDLTVTQFVDPAQPSKRGRHTQEPWRHLRRRCCHLQEYRHCRRLAGHLQRHRTVRFNWPGI